MKVKSSVKLQNMILVTAKTEYRQNFIIVARNPKSIVTSIQCRLSDEYSAPEIHDIHIADLGVPIASSYADAIHEKLREVRIKSFKNDLIWEINHKQLVNPTLFERCPNDNGDSWEDHAYSDDPEDCPFCESCIIFVPNIDWSAMYDTYKNIIYPKVYGFAEGVMKNDSKLCDVDISDDVDMNGIHALLDKGGAYSGGLLCIECPVDVSQFAELYLNNNVVTFLKFREDDVRVKQTRSSIKTFLKLHNQKELREERKRERKAKEEEKRYQQRLKRQLDDIRSIQPILKS